MALVTQHKLRTAPLLPHCFGPFQMTTRIILNGSGINISTERSVHIEYSGQLDCGTDVDDLDPYIFWPRYGAALLLYGQLDEDSEFFEKLK